MPAAIQPWSESKTEDLDFPQEIFEDRSTTMSDIIQSKGVKARWKKPVWVPAHVVLSYEQCTPALCSSELTTPSSRGGYYVRRATTGYDPHPTLSFPGSQACSSHHGTRGAGCPK
ncbi:unnamed protein product [Boreogadus saida]